MQTQIKYCKCGDHIPSQRIDMGYDTCINCSSENRYSALPINFHKTGNTVQIIKDPEVAKRVHHMSKRSGFGILRGMRTSPKKKMTSNTKKSASICNSQIANSESKLLPENILRGKKRAKKLEPHKKYGDFTKYRDRCIQVLNKYGYKAALRELKSMLEKDDVTIQSYMDINNVINLLK